jgi:serine/threonine-protein kinase haspin
LALKLLYAKRLKAPSVSKKAAASTGYAEWECYESLAEVEAVLGKCVKDIKKRKAKKIEVTGGASLKSAAEVVGFGVGKGWVRL